MLTVDETLFSYITSLAPAAIDLELRSLVTLEHLKLFLNALTRRLRSRRDFEAVQTFLNVLLRLHGEVMVANPEIREDLEKVKDAQVEESRRILEAISSSLGALSFVRDVL